MAKDISKSSNIDATQASAAELYQFMKRVSHPHLAQVSPGQTAWRQCWSWQFQEHLSARPLIESIAPGCWCCSIHGQMLNYGICANSDISTLR